MKNRQKSKNNKALGFTLVELMVVMAIVALLAAAAVPQFQNYAMRARWAKNIAAISSLQTAIGACLSSHALEVQSCDTVEKVGVTPVLPHANPQTPQIEVQVLDQTPVLSIVMVGSDEAGGCEVSAQLQLKSGGEESSWELKRKAEPAETCNASTTGVSAVAA